MPQTPTLPPEADSVPAASRGAAQPQPASAGNEASTTQQKKTLFGLQQPETQMGGAPAPTFRDDYEKRLPPDEYGQEMAPNARVWRAYEEEAATFDTALVGQSRDGLDVMLVFAGLFSAVVTSFLIQASNNLQADFSQMTALLLHDIVVMQIEAGGASGRNVTVPSADPTAAFEPDALSVWVNGLWAVSLTTSLVVALSAVLVKQWLHHYVTLPSGTPQLRSHVRHFRFMGLEKWRVVTIIGALPIIMHFSLTLFFIGLILFYIPLRLSLALTICVLSTIVLLVYIATNAIPIMFPECPYQTPFTHLLHYSLLVANRVRGRTSATAKHIKSRIVVLSHAMGLSCNHQPATPRPYLSRSESLSMRESDVVHRDYDELCLAAIDWLFRTSTNPSLCSLVVQAIAALPSRLYSDARELWEDDGEMRTAQYQLIAALTNISEDKCIIGFNCHGREAELERLLRSFLPFGHSIYAKHTIPCGHPRLQAAVLATTIDPYYIYGDLPNFLHALQAIETHQLPAQAWRNVLTMVYQKLRILPADRNPYRIAWIELIVWLYAQLFTRHDSDTMPSQPENHQDGLYSLQAVVCIPSFYDSLLAPLVGVFAFVPHEDPRLRGHSLAARIGNTLARFLLRNLKVNSPIYKNAVSLILDHVCTTFDKENLRFQMELEPATKITCEAALELCQLVTEGVSLAVPDAVASDVCFFCLTKLLSTYYYLQLEDDIINLGFVIPSSGLLVDALFHLALNSPIVFNVPHTPVTKADYWFSSLRLVMQTAVAGNPLEALELFKKYDWPRLLCEVRGTGSLAIIIESYVDCLERHSDRNGDSEFPAESRNLTLLCVSAIVDIYYSRRSIKSLAGFNPGHPAWVEVLSKLTALCAWCENDDSMADLDFPLNGLFGQTMLTEPGSMDDIIKNSFIKDKDHRTRARELLELLKEKREDAWLASTTTK